MNCNMKQPPKAQPVCETWVLDLESLFKLCYPMCIICSKKDDRFTGCIVNTIFQIVPEPLMVAVSVNKKSLTYPYYRDVKQGRTPRTATTYIEKKTISGQGAKEMKKYKCLMCGYIYDPAVGDPDNGVEANTAFENLPDDWVCPDCGVGKDEFEPAED